MKILNTQQIKYLDQSTIISQKITETVLMRRAGDYLTEAIMPFLNKNEGITILCGKGNNGGDGLVVAMNLYDAGYKIELVVFGSSKKGSEGFEKMWNEISRIKEIEKTENQYANEVDLKNQVIDALFGSGLCRTISGEYRKLIERINDSVTSVYSIDVPSGLPTDLGIDADIFIHAERTFTIGQPKITLLLPEYKLATKHWQIVDIGLDDHTLESIETLFYYTDKKALVALSPRNKFVFKGNFGHALIIAGSKGMTGACGLSALSCLTSGAGLVTAFTPAYCAEKLQSSIMELMTIEDVEKDFVSSTPDLSKFTTIGLGPGLGTHRKTKEVITKILREYDGPIVLDADGINALEGEKLENYFRENRHYKTILTPHPGEFDRLFGQHNTTIKRIEKAQEMCVKFKIILVLKGAYTAVISERGDVYFNSTGTPAMAKAGSGDVLTGILTALVGKDSRLFEMVRLGVFIHGRSGEYAENEKDTECVLASDLIKHLPKAFKDLRSTSYH